MLKLITENLGLYCYVPIRKHIQLSYQLLLAQALMMTTTTESIDPVLDYAYAFMASTFGIRSQHRDAPT